MKKFSDVISEFNNIQKDFAFLQSINLSRDFNENGCSEYSLNIVLSDYPYYEGNQKLLLTFFGVRNFNTGDLDGLVRHFIHITDVLDHQMEGIKYKVREDENDVFSFYCNTFEYEILS
jgi:hypothetical protein